MNQFIGRLKTKWPVKSFSCPTCSQKVRYVDHCYSSSPDITFKCKCGTISIIKVNNISI